MAMADAIKCVYSLLFGRSRTSLLVNTSKESKQVLIIILTIILSIALPIIYLGSLPLIFCRKLHEKFVRRFWSKSYRILHPTGQTMVSDFFQENPIQNIVFCSVVEGRLTTEELKQTLSTKWMLDNSASQSASGKQKGKSLFPELKQQCVNLCGYYYWAPIPDFDVNDYVQEFTHEDLTKLNILPPNNDRNSEDEKVTLENNNEDASGTDGIFSDDMLKPVVAHLTSKSWRKDQSPWEFYVIHNYKDTTAEGCSGGQAESMEKTLVIFRTHHFFMDGYSLLNLILSLVSGDKELAAIPNFNSGSPLQMLVYKASIWLRTPYALALRLLVVGVDQNDWRICMTRMSRKCYSSWTRGVSIDDLKLIKKEFGVSFQAVLHALIGKAMANLMENAGQNIPKSLRAVVPVPLPNHPEGLENYFTFACPTIPIDEADAEKRLMLAFKQLKIAARSLAPIIAYPIHNYGGHFPDFITKHTIAFNPGNSIAFTSFPGINGPSYFCGKPYLDIFGTIGTSIGNAGASLTAVSCFGKVRFGITIDTGVFPSQEILLKYDEFICNEVNLLLKKCRT